MVGSCMRAARTSAALLNALGGGSGVPATHCTGLRDAAAGLLHAAGPVLPWAHASPVHSTQGAHFSPQRHSMAAAAAGTPSTGGLHIHLPWKRPEPTHKGVLIDAAGTLLSPSEPAALVYARYAHKHGFEIKHKDVLGRYRRAYNAPWGGSTIRYVGDGRPFWRHIVREATGIASQEVFEDIYNYYQSAHAWHVATGAVQALSRLRVAGVRLAVVSNFDTRLKPLLQELGIGHLFDAVVVSAEVGVEKPNPIIYETALQQLGLKPHEVLHVGDDRRNDVWGARDAGVAAWLWGDDVHSFDEVADRVLYGKLAQEYWEHVHDHEHEHQPQQDHGR